MNFNKGNFKTNFKFIKIEDDYMIYNERYQAIIDKTVFDILNFFEIKTIDRNLLNTLYELNFIV